MNPKIIPSPSTWITEREDPEQWFNSLKQELKDIEREEGYK